MPTHDLPLLAVARPVGSLWLNELLFFPELSALGTDPQRGRRDLHPLIRELLRDAPLLDVHRRATRHTATAERVAVSFPSPRHRAHWRAPVSLDLGVVRWTQRHTEVVFVPALGIEVLARTEDELRERLPREIRDAVGRRPGPVLERLRRLQDEPTVELTPHDLSVDLLSPKQQAQDALETRTEPLLPKLARDLRKTPRTAYARGALVARLAEWLTGRRPRSVLLVGPPGAGKSALLEEVVRRRAKLGLGGVAFWELRGGHVVGGATGFGEWQRRCAQLAREAAAQPTVLALGHLTELIEAGKSPASAQGVGEALRPSLVRGAFLAVAECTEQEYAWAEREAPQIVSAFQRLDVDPTDPDTTAQILEGRAASEELRGRPRVDADALAEIDRLHRRFATYSASPGRAVRFLEETVADAQAADRPTVGAADVRTAFGRRSGLPHVLVDPSAPLDLDATERWFEARVLGQPEAVARVVDLLAMVRAGLHRPQRPLGSLLLCGPTGVGKTELAKALAEFVFGDRERLIRIDMSEYADPFAVGRLIGGVGAADEGVLTAPVREQPFSVVLLDEFEKAHPALFDVLLQVLGEGRLTDARGRTADFSQAIVIMTSNLGAEAFGQGRPGFGGGEVDDAAAHFEATVQRFLRPELFNRLDQVIPFAPLAREIVRQIARRELTRIRERPGLRDRGVRLEVEDAVLDALAADGYDPRYGARPLKRSLERRLVAPLADQLNRYDPDTALDVAVTHPLQIDARARRVDGQVSLRGRDAAGGALAQQVAVLRRQLQRLARGPSFVELRNEQFRLERAEAGQLRSRASRKHAPVFDAKRLGALRQARAAAEALTAEVDGLEEEALLAAWGEGERPGEARLQGVEDRWGELLRAVFALKRRDTERAVLAIYADEDGWRDALVEAYCAAATASGCTVRLGRVVFAPPGKASPRALHVPASGEEEPGWVDPSNVQGLVGRAGTLGVALWITGPLAGPRFGEEGGLHVHKQGERHPRAVVHVFGGEPTAYRGPAGLERKAGIGEQVRRRLYDPTRHVVLDATLSDAVRWEESLGEVLGDCVERRLVAEIEAEVLA